jgi:hypothetical protein
LQAIRRRLLVVAESSPQIGLDRLVADNIVKANDHDLLYDTVLLCASIETYEHTATGLVHTSTHRT